MEDCIFCKIASGLIPSDKVYEDERIYAFRDIAPQAPVHVLVIPKAHYDNVKQCRDADAELMGRLFFVAANLAQSENIDESGFRLVTNCGPDGAQSVNHFHIHLLGGAQLSGKMG